MWYASSMEIITEGAIRPEQAVGKPLVVFVEGKKRQIGTITHATVKDAKLYIAAEINLNQEKS